MKTLREFIKTYVQYRKAAHGPVYAARIAYSVAILKTPF